MKNTLIPLMTTLALLFPALAAAEHAGLAVELVAHRVLPSAKPGAAEQLEAALQARPGDLLEYRVRYHNGSSEPLKQVLATLPIPAAGAVYVPGSAKPAGALASTDGRRFEPEPLRRWVVLPDGSRVQKLVPATEYRFLRWNLGDLAANQAAIVSARVRVADGADAYNQEQTK